MAYDDPSWRWVVVSRSRGLRPGLRPERDGPPPRTEPEPELHKWHLLDCHQPNLVVLEGSLPWRATTDPNAGPSLAEDPLFPYEGWFIWGSWVGGARVFSTPEEGGSLKTQGGWLLFIMDTCGVWMFGTWWPTVGTLTCLVIAVCLLGATAWSLQVLRQLWCCQCLRAGCRRVWMGEGLPDHRFEETPPVRGF